jgi:hypothetical protein
MVQGPEMAGVTDDVRDMEVQLAHRGGE